MSSIPNFTLKTFEILDKADSGIREYELTAKLGCKRLEGFSAYQHKTYSGGPILAKNNRLISLWNDAVVHVFWELGFEIEATGVETSSNFAVPFLSCSRTLSAYAQF